MQRPEGGRTDPYDYNYAWAVCGVYTSSRQGILRTRWLDPRSNNDSGEC